MALIEDKVPLVLFSGGLDSTVLLLESLYIYKYVDVCVIKQDGQTNKSNREMAAVAAIRTELDKMRKRDTERMGTIRWASFQTVPGMLRIRQGFGQSTGWMTAAYHSLAADTSEIMTGYLNTDHQAPIINETKKAWSAILGSNGFDILEVKKPPLTTPFIFMSKDDVIIKSASSAHSRVMKHVSWCESPDEGADCGRCPSCLTMMKSLNTIKTFEPEVYARTAFRGRFVKMMAKRRKKLTKTAPEIHAIETKDIPK